MEVGTFLESCRVRGKHGSPVGVILSNIILHICLFNFVYNSFVHLSHVLGSCFTPIIPLLSTFFFVSRATTKKIQEISKTYAALNHLY